MDTAKKITLKDVVRMKDSSQMPKAIYVNNSYVVISPEGAIQFSGTFSELAQGETGYGYYRDLEVKVRERDINGIDNTRVDGETAQEQLENKVNEMAAKVVPSESLQSFLELDIEAKLTGIATFAHMAGEEDVRNLALETIAQGR